jgi:hypothetical protein
LVLFLILLTALPCLADTITDPFAQPQNNCSYSASPPYSSCDVIGNPQLYDIQAASVSIVNGMATAAIELNSGAVQQTNGQLTLGSFSDVGLTLIPGDVFFYNPLTVYDPSDPATAQYLQYGIALENHGSFVAGDLYEISGSISTETAEQALDYSEEIYRNGEAVLMTGSGIPVSSGTVSVADWGDGINEAEYLITVTVPTTAGLLSLVSNDQIGLLFSSADCGNDVIQGTVGTDAQAPEPGSMAMVVIGLGLLVASRRRRHGVAVSGGVTN